MLRKPKRRDRPGSGQANPERPSLERRLQLLDESGKSNRNLGFTYLLYLGFITMATFNTTPVMVFLGKASFQIPVLGMDVSLFAFYAIAPLILLFFQFFVLFNLKKHLGKVRAEGAEPDGIFPFFLNYAFFGPSGWERRSLRAAVALLYGLFGAVALVYLSWKAVYLREPWMTWTHVGGILLELGILGYLVSILLGHGSRPFTSRLNKTFFPLRSSQILFSLLGLCSLPLLVLGLAVTDLDADYETFVQNDLAVELAKETRLVIQQHDLEQWWSLQYPDLDKEDRKYDFRRRNFRYAELYELDLKEALISMILLDHVQLVGTQLDKAMLLWGQLNGADLWRSQLNGADLTGAQLNGANL